MRGTSRMLAPSRTEYRSEHCARVSPAAWRDPQAERLLFFGGVVPCAVIERHPKLTAGVPPRERRTHTSLTYTYGAALADAKSRWVPKGQKSYLLSSHCSPGPPNPPKSAHSRQLGPVDSCIPVG